MTLRSEADISDWTGINKGLKKVRFFKRELQKKSVVKNHLVARFLSYLNFKILVITFERKLMKKCVEERGEI